MDKEDLDVVVLISSPNFPSWRMSLEAMAPDHERIIVWGVGTDGKPMYNGHLVWAHDWNHAFQLVRNELDAMILDVSASVGE